MIFDIILSRLLTAVLTLIAKVYLFIAHKGDKRKIDKMLERDYHGDHAEFALNAIARFLSPIFIWILIAAFLAFIITGIFLIARNVIS